MPLIGEQINVDEFSRAVGAARLPSIFQCDGGARIDPYDATEIGLAPELFRESWLAVARVALSAHATSEPGSAKHKHALFSLDKLSRSLRAMLRGMLASLWAANTRSKQSARVSVREVVDAMDALDSANLWAAAARDGLETPDTSTLPRNQQGTVASS